MKLIDDELIFEVIEAKMDYGILCTVVLPRRTWTKHLVLKLSNTFVELRITTCFISARCYASTYIKVAKFGSIVPP